MKYSKQEIIDDLVISIKDLIREKGCSDPDCCSTAIRAEKTRIIAQAKLDKYGLK